MSAAVTPRSIEPTADGSALQIVWEDGRTSTYLPRTLRLLCPCAGCVDEMTGRRTLVPSHVPDQIYPTAIHYVGRYALQFVWSDGHSTGLYSFDYLRRIDEDPGA